MLAASGASEDDLVCGPHASLNDDVAKEMNARGEKPTKASNNCSGKHAGMIGLARHCQWGSKGYERPDHPLQRRCLQEVGRWTGVAPERIPFATDGCGVPTFALPLQAMALGWARLGAAFAGDPVSNASTDARTAAATLVEAMTKNPFLVAGSARLDTELMQAVNGRIVTKVGAEGVYCAAIPAERVGIALKIEDGAPRCLGPALLGLFDQLLPGVVPAFEDHRHPAITNTLHAAVGRIEPRIVLDRAASQ